MKPRAYYNEFDKGAAAWLRALIQKGLIADGEIDTRSIVDVRPADLRGFRQCHFFAGIGGWSLALRLAGWPDDREAWTGSCPCQPFSVAGASEGTADPRHLWPAWFPLIRERRPPTVFGEQVASKDGGYWLDIVLADLEGSAYACGAFDLPAASVGAPHGRQRLWFVADDDEGGREQLEAARLHERRPRARSGEAAAGDPDRARRHHPERRGGSGGGTVGDAGVQRRRARTPAAEGRQAGHGALDAGGVVDAQRAGLEGHAGHGDHGDQSRWFGTQPAGSAPTAGPTSGFWYPADWLPCIDGKARPVEPGTFPLADGVPARVGRLRGYGNAIVPEVAAEVIRAYMEIRK